MTGGEKIEYDEIFGVSNHGFEALALRVFARQFAENELYGRFCRQLNKTPANVTRLEDIPFLPIAFFKTHEIKTGDFRPELIFESSGTTGSTTSRHSIKDRSLYTQSFINGFKRLYGEPSSWCILGLLPSYLERGNSSLVFMVDELIRLSGDPDSGTFLHDHEKLNALLRKKSAERKKVLLFGVTYALLDFADAFPQRLKNVTVIETGGMKGRREELSREAVHDILRDRFGLRDIHSEYGMTEMLSQAYSSRAGIFQTPPWLKIVLREEDDSLSVSDRPAPGRSEMHGGINVIDLANIHSCSFIATDDAGTVFEDGSFKVNGRLDNTDIRGCSLLAV